MKPLPPTKLKAGQAIGAADKLVDTFNWLVDATENLKGDGCFIYVNKANPEVPQIELDIDSVQDFFNGQLSGLSGCSCELTCSISSDTKIGSFTNDGWQTSVDLYVPSITGATICVDCHLSSDLTAGQKIATFTDDGWATHEDLYISVDISSDISSGMHIADFTTDGWRTSKPLYISSDLSNDVLWLNRMQSITPFYYDFTTQTIKNNFLYIGRQPYVIPDYQVNPSVGGTYFLHVVTDSYGAVSTTEIVLRATATIPPAWPTNNDTETYYALWYIEIVNGVPMPMFDYRQMFKLPFYST